MRKAQFLELDFLLAVTLLIAGIILLKGGYIHTYDAPQIESTAEDLNTLLHTTNLGDLDAAFTKNLKNDLQGTGLNTTNATSVARLAAALYITGENDGDPALRNHAGRLVRQTYAEAGVHANYNVTILSAEERHTITSTDAPITKAATTTRTLLSGFQVDKPVSGYTANAYLARGGTTRHATTRLGGFIGQGNITLLLDIPSHAHTIQDLYLEGNFHEDFNIIVNSHHCRHVTVTGAGDPFAAVTSESLTGCASHLRTGTNTLTINFTNGTLDQHYVGGGYLQATYLSDRTYEAPATITESKPIPGVHGTFNLYDGIYIPGDLQSMTIDLHYHANHTDNNNEVFFTLGDTLLWTDNTSTTPQHVTLTDEDLHDAGISYDEYDNQTIPYRFGYDNGSMELLASNVIDAALVTDVSGSMGWNFTHDWSAGSAQYPSCDSDDLYSPSTERLTVAKCANKNFTHLILNQEGQLLEPNRIGLASYNGDVDSSTPLSHDQSYLESEIDSYNAGGSTCICCGVLEGGNVINDSHHEPHWDNVTRAMLVMTDGVANQAPYGCRRILRDYYGGAVGDLNGDGEANDAGDYAVAAANYSRRELNISLYIVGFGTRARLDEDTLRAMAAVDNASHYYLADSPQALADVYNDIARDIIRIANYNAQVLSFDVNVNTSTVYPDSRIEYTYEANPLPELKGKLLIDGERQPFATGDSCEATDVFFPPALYPLEGSITSYSGEHWTDHLSVNDHTIYELTDYGDDYRALGDPFSIGIPPGVMTRGPNEFSLTTADSPTEPAGCSPHNKLLYTATINNTFSLDSVYPEAEGCTWTLDRLGETATMSLPADYSGDNECSYQSGDVTYDNDDAWQALGHRLFTALDIEDDGEVDVDFAAEDLHLNAEQRSDIPYLWGPAILEVSVWR